MSSRRPLDAGDRSHSRRRPPVEPGSASGERPRRRWLMPLGLLAVGVVAVAATATVVPHSSADVEAPPARHRPVGDVALAAPSGGTGSDGRGSTRWPPATSAPGRVRTERTAAAAPVSDTLRVQGNRLVDTCGQPFLVRGAETFLGLGIDIGGSRIRVVEEMVSTGVNAVRLIPNVNQLSVGEVDRFLATAAAAKVVVFLTPNGGRSWFRRSDVKTMLNRYRKWLIIDAYGEAPYDDRNRWQNDVQTAIRDIRSAGYTVPLTVLSNMYGRDLPALFERGAAIVGTDPLRNTVLGWQAYWGRSGWYQGLYGMSLTEGIRRSSQQAFPIQIGIDHFADPGEPMDYPAAMSAAQRYNVGWLWWDWYNPFGRTDNLTADGTAERLTDVGEEVLAEHAAGIRATARKACGL